MKRFLALLSVGLLMFGVAACSESDVNTGGSGNTTEVKSGVKPAKNDDAKQDNTKKVDASAQKVNALGMQVGLGEIKIEEDKISVGVNLANTTNKELDFYPDQGHLVIGDMQLESNILEESGKIGGEVQSNVKQQGVIVFDAPDGKKIDIKAVSQIKLMFGDVMNQNFESKSVDFTIPVK